MESKMKVSEIVIVGIAIATFVHELNESKKVHPVCVDHLSAQAVAQVRQAVVDPRHSVGSSENEKGILPEHVCGAVEIRTLDNGEIDLAPGIAHVHEGLRYVPQFGRHAGRIESIDGQSKPLAPVASSVACRNWTFGRLVDLSHLGETTSSGWTFGRFTRYPQDAPGS